MAFRPARLYLAICALGFEQYRTSVHQVLAVRPHVDGTSEVAPTRRNMEVDRHGLSRWTRPPIDDWIQVPAGYSRH